jgi:5S rRNA maturation endonuclease (ribonuclease M5)
MLEEEDAPKSVDSSLYKADIGELDAYRYYHPYLTSRGLSKAFILNNKIGFDKLTARVTIPIFLDGVYYGCAKRTVIDEQPKITYNSGMPKSEIVYKPLTSDGNSEYLLIVEGPIDALKSSYYNQDAVAILGCQPSAKQLELAQRIANGRTIILALDNDNPGKRGTEKWIDMVIDMDTTVMVYPENIKDIGEMNEQQFNNSLENSILFWEYAN